jgi:citrate lyase subunit beta/citryl-CoA lyase
LGGESRKKTVEGIEAKNMFHAIKRRSWLFVPADNPKKMEKAIHSGADAVIFDLEDAVAAAQKESARQMVAEVFDVGQGITKPVYVRINDPAQPAIMEDLKLISELQVHGILIPKTEGAEQVQMITAMLKRHDIELLPIIETALGLHNVMSIAGASERITQLTFGSLDFSLDLGMDPSSDGSELYFARFQLVLASRICNLLAPVDTVYPQYSDKDGFQLELETARRMGFLGKLLIHPAQIEQTNAVFEPTAKEMEWALKVITAFEKAKARGIGVVQVDGKMVDLPVYRKAQKLKVF